MTPTEAPIPEILDPEIEQNPYGEDFRDLPQQLVDLIKGTIKDFQKQDTYLRRMEVMRDRKARFYERGYQHLAWSGGAMTGGFQLITAGMQMANSNAQAPQYVDDYDIFWPYERIQLSVLTQNPPGIDFQPEDPNRSSDVEAANTAEGYTKIFDRHNNVKSLQTQALRFMMLGGRTISWTRTEENGQKWGYNDDGSAKQAEVTTEYGTLETRVPIMAKCQDDAMYVFLFDDPQVNWAKTKYSWIRDQIKGNESGLGENQYERLARLGALQGSRQTMATGESFSYLVTEMHCWLRPEAWGGKEYDVAFDGEPGLDGLPVSCRDKLLELFPDGGCFVFVGQTYAKAYSESMDDALHIAFPFEGDGMYRKAPMDAIIVNQDAFNDAMNATRQVFDVGWPSRWVDADDVEFDTIVNQTATPYAFRQKKLKPDKSIKDVVHQEENPETPQTFELYKEKLSGELPQFQTATPPALWGQQMPDQKTAHGYAQAQQSAMGQLGMLWGVLQHHFARIRYQSALCAAKNPDYSEQIVIPGDGNQTTSLTLANITKGKFRCFPDEDSSFPETTAAKRATLTQVLEMLTQAQSPLAAQIMGAPDNVSNFLRTFGLAELTVPEAMAREAQQLEIEELIQQSPMVSPMALQMAEQQHAQMILGGGEQIPFDPTALPPDQPSVPINEYDYHQWHAMKCQDWLNGNDCRKQLARVDDEHPNGNQVGVLNVVLHWKAHVAAMQAMMAPPPEAVPAPGEGGESPEAESPEAPQEKLEVSIK